jgi:methylglutaconyl-CoA hydratase
MAAWDPYADIERIAYEGDPDSHKPEAPAEIFDIWPYVTPKPDIPLLKKYPEDQVETLMQAVNAYIDAGTPWKKVPSVRPRLDWHTPTCTPEDWRHKDVKLQLSQGIAYVTLNRPSEGNTLNDTIMHGLTDAIFSLHARQDIRVVVFMAEGPIFCAGLDPNATKHRRAGSAPAVDAGDGSAARNPIPRKEQTPEAKEAFAKLEQQALAAGAFPDGKVNSEQVFESMLWQTMTRLPQVTIAVVNGSVMSTGFSLISCVEMTIAVKSSYFCMEDLFMGLVPSILMPHMVQKLGGSNARYAMLTAKNLSAAEAKKIGLVQEVSEDIAGAHKRVAVMCEAVNACGPRSVEKCKELVNGVAGNPLTEKLSFFTANMLRIVTLSEEAKVGMVALQARQPKPWDPENQKIKPLF